MAAASNEGDEQANLQAEGKVLCMRRVDNFCRVELREYKGEEYCTKSGESRRRCKIMERVYYGRTMDVEPRTRLLK